MDRLSSMRVAELDGLRGGAVLLVLIWHFVGGLVDQNLGGWAKPLYGIIIFGRTGVDLFFVLSGFLITGIVLDRQRSPFAFLRSFYIRRFLRIVPPYLLLLAVFWSAIALGVRNGAFNTDIPWLHLVTFTQNWWMSTQDRWGPSAISVTWSVAIEEQFYVLFPLLVLLTPQKRLTILFVVIAAGSACFRAAAWLMFHSAFTMYVQTLSRLDGLAAGAMVAWAWRHPEFQTWMSAHKCTVRRVLKALAWCLPVFLVALRIDLPLTMAVWGHTYLTMLYALALLVIIASLPAGGIRMLRQGWLTRLGAVSYTVYLFHQMFLDGIFLLAGRPERVSTLQDVVLASVALFSTLLWSSVSLRYLERPFIKAGRSFRY